MLGLSRIYQRTEPWVDLARRCESIYQLALTISVFILYVLHEFLDGGEGTFSKGTRCGDDVWTVW